MIQIIVPVVFAIYENKMVLPGELNVMSKPIPDKAEIVLEYPEKFYVGTFERSARFDAHFDDKGASLLLDHPGDVDARKSVHLHVHYALLADILSSLTRTVSAIPTDHDVRDLAEVARGLYEALGARITSADETEKPSDPHASDLGQMSPEEEVLLLHVME